MESHNKINIFWHICAINHWKEVVSDQFDCLYKSGLFFDCEKIHITFLGNNSKDLDWILSDKIEIRNFSKNLKHYEKLCLNDLRTWSETNDSYVFYFHTKGVSKPQYKENIWAWRKMMEHFLIEKYIKCVDFLETNDAIGISICDVGTDAKISNENHKFHFSGNFWWSKTDYLKFLPKIPELDMSVAGNYWLCERWVLHPWPNVRAFEMYKSKHVHYYEIQVEDYLLHE